MQLHLVFSLCSVLYLIPHVQALSVTLSLQTSPAYIKGERYIVSWNVEMETNEDRGSGSLFIVKQRGSGQLSDDPLEASFNESLTGEGSFAFGGTGTYKLVAYRHRLGDLSYAERVGESAEVQVIGKNWSVAVPPSSTSSSASQSTSNPTETEVATEDTGRKSRSRKDTHTAIIVGAVLGSITLVLLVLLIWQWRRTSRLAQRLADIEAQNHNRPNPAPTQLFHNTSSASSEMTITAFPLDYPSVPPPRYKSGVVKGREGGTLTHVSVSSDGSSSRYS